MINYRIKAYEGASVTVHETAEEVTLLEVNIRFTPKQSPRPITVEWELPCVELVSHLNIDGWSEVSKSLGANWRMRTTKSHLCTGAPVHCLLGADQKNRLTIAAADAATPLEIKTGIIEEGAMLFCRVVFFTQPLNPLEEYRTLLRIDRRPLPFYQTFARVDAWWQEQGLRCAPVPPAAKQPMYSTWYSLHQKYNTTQILEQCRLAKEMGMETVIIDDGWQTEDTHRGYAYCGDWEPNPFKIPNMNYLVNQVHRLDMKLMLWYSVPVIGKYTKAYQEFQDCFLPCIDETEDWRVLDLRLPRVREHLLTLYETAMKTYQLDGLKLDFSDYFQFFHPAENTNRSTAESIETAIQKLLRTAYRRLRKINPNVMLEFRQPCIGPEIRRYGNMLRATCHGVDPLVNRCRTILLRLTSGSCAVHSDPIKWHPAESVESAARQLLNVLFSVPQISVLLDQLPEEHMKMLQFYLSVWRKYREPLLEGTLVPCAPEANFTKISAQKGLSLVTVLYEDKVAQVPKACRILAIINAKGDDEILLDAPINETRWAIIYDCTGNITEEHSLPLNGISRLTVPVSGMVEIV